MNFGGQTPTIVVLKEGTDTSQGKGQTISNINACIAVSDTLRPTLGPMGSDVMLVDAQGKTTISNDGATILSLLEIVHPAARLLVDISRSQDAEVGDGTSSVTILAGELLKEARAFVEDNVPVQAIIKGYRRALTASLQYINTLKKEIDVKSDEDLRKVAATAMSSKIIHQNAEFFTKMVVDAIRSLDAEDLNEKMIGIKTVTGGAIQDSLFVGGTAFKKTFSYAGFEQQPKRFTNPKICCLDVELELKAEKDNAEVRVKEVSEYQNIVDAEWKIIIDKLEAIAATGAEVVLSSLPIGDLATQFFADRDIFCAGRVAAEDMDRVLCSTGAVQQSTCSSIKDEYLGRCELFEERQIGNERFNFFTGGASARSCTLILRGGSEQFISEVERSLHDALMVVKRTVRNSVVVAGGGACEMAVSKHLREMARKISSKEQLVVGAYARALEVIPRQLSENAGFDSTDLMNLLRMRHARDEANVGIDFSSGSVADNLEKFVWEPALVKINALSSATEAACVVLSVDETVQNKESASQAQMPIPR